MKTLKNTKLTLNKTTIVKIDKSNFLQGGCPQPSQRCTCSCVEECQVKGFKNKQ